YGVRTGRAGGHHGVIGAFEPKADRHVTGGKIDDASGNEERRDPTRPALLQQNSRIGNSPPSADPRTYEDSRCNLVLLGCRLPTRVFKRLLCRTHGKDDKLVDLALLLRLHPLIRLIGAVGAVPAGYLTGNARGQVGYINPIDPADPALASDKTTPRGFDA